MNRWIWRYAFSRTLARRHVKDTAISIICLPRHAGWAVFCPVRVFSPLPIGGAVRVRTGTRIPNRRTQRRANDSFRMKVGRSSLQLRLMAVYQRSLWRYYRRTDTNYHQQLTNAFFIKTDTHQFPIERSMREVISRAVLPCLYRCVWSSTAW